MNAVGRQTDIVTRATLRDLLAIENAPAVSIFMPTYDKGIDTLQGPIRLKNLLNEAETQLMALEEQSANTRDLLAPAHALLDDALFWQHQSAGLALFLAADLAEMRILRVPLSLEEQVVTGERLHVKPLLSLLSDDGTFYLLTLNQNGVHLYQGSRFTLSEADIPTPSPQTALEEVGNDNSAAASPAATGASRGRSAGEREAMSYTGSAEGGESLLKDQTLRSFQHLDDGVRNAIQEGGGAPLVLVGVEYLQGLYRQANEYKFLLETGVEKDPDSLTLEAMHELAWPLVEPQFMETRRQALDQYQHLAGTDDGRAAAKIEEIVPAAYFQRIDTLFVAQGLQQWGRFDMEASTVQLHATAESDDEELLDFAAVHTLLNGGTVYLLDPVEMPDGAPLAAIFRY
ncbi:MAG: hypothetical protein M3Q45_09165 [Chloroflexota bacterium]|nr:hypothetical protein [Chloroflexota bacterium]